MFRENHVFYASPPSTRCGAKLAEHINAKGGHSPSGRVVMSVNGSSKARRGKSSATSKGNDRRRNSSKSRDQFTDVE